MQVLEDQNRQLAGRHIPEQHAHPVEELQIVGRSRGLAILLPNLRQKTSELTPRGPREGLEPRLVHQLWSDRQRIDPRAEWKDLLTFVATTNQDPTIHLGSL